MSSPDMEAGLAPPTASDAVHDLTRFATEPTHRAFLAGMGIVLVLQEGPDWMRTLAAAAAVVGVARYAKAVLLGK
jgi:hypothetical protein